MRNEHDANKALAHAPAQGWRKVTQRLPEPPVRARFK